jgi:hypothetical protein
MGSGKHHHRTGTKNNNKEGEKQHQQKQQHETRTRHNLKPIVTKEGLRKGGTRTKSSAEKKSPNGVDGANKLDIKKQGRRGAGTGTPTPTTISNISSNKKQGLREAGTGTPTPPTTRKSSSNNNNKSINDCNATPNKSSTSTNHTSYAEKRKPKSEDDHDKLDLGDELSMAQALSSATTSFATDDDTRYTDGDKKRQEKKDSSATKNGSNDKSSSSKLERAQRRKEARTELQQKEQEVPLASKLVHWEPTVHAKQVEEDYHSIVTSSSSFTSSAEEGSVGGKCLHHFFLGTQNIMRLCCGTVMVNEFLEEFFFTAADCVENNCSPAGLRRKAACFDCTYGKDLTNRPEAELYAEHLHGVGVNEPAVRVPVRYALPTPNTSSLLRPVAEEHHEEDRADVPNLLSSSTDDSSSTKSDASSTLPSKNESFNIRKNASIQQSYAYSVDPGAGAGDVSNLTSLRLDYHNKRNPSQSKQRNTHTHVRSSTNGAGAAARAGSNVGLPMRWSYDEDEQEEGNDPELEFLTDMVGIRKKQRDASRRMRYDAPERAL